MNEADYRPTEEELLAQLDGMRERYLSGRKILSPAEVLASVCTFAKKLEAHFPEYQVWLRGSYTRGEETSASDINVDVVLPYDVCEARSFVNLARLFGELCEGVPHGEKICAWARRAGEPKRGMCIASVGDWERLDAEGAGSGQDESPAEHFHRLVLEANEAREAAGIPEPTDDEIVEFVKSVRAERRSAAEQLRAIFEEADEAIAASGLPTPSLEEIVEECEDARREMAQRRARALPELDGCEHLLHEHFAEPYDAAPEQARSAATSKRRTLGIVREVELYEDGWDSDELNALIADLMYGDSEKFADLMPEPGAERLGDGFPEEEPNEESLEAIEETKRILESGAGRFKTVEEMFASIDSDVTLE